MSFLRGSVLSFLMSFDDFLILLQKYLWLEKYFVPLHSYDNSIIGTQGSEKLRLSIPKLL